MITICQGAGLVAQVAARKSYYQLPPPPWKESRPGRDNYIFLPLAGWLVLIGITRMPGLEAIFFIFKVGIYSADLRPYTY